MLAFRSDLARSDAFLASKDDSGNVAMVDYSIEE
jgi:hypothetical protein